MSSTRSPLTVLGALIHKEMRALTRDVQGLAALFLMPALFVLVMSLALQDVYRDRPPPLRWAVQVQDDGRPAAALLAQWTHEQGAPQPWPADADEALRQGRLHYLLVLRPGVSEELTRPGLPTHAFLTLRAEPGLNAQVWYQLQAQLLAAAGELKARLALAQEGLSPAPGASIRRLLAAERLGGRGPRPSAVQQNVPAWLVFGLFFVVASMSHLLVQERDSGTLARLHSLGVGPVTLLASKALPYLAVNALQAALMLALGVWGVPALGGEALSVQGVSWPALALVLACISLAAVSTGLAVASVVRTPAQAFAVGPVCNVLMAALGGIMVPTFVMPTAMQQLATASPMNWGLEALLTVLLRDADAALLASPLGRLVVFAVALFAFAGVILRRHSR